MGSAWKQLPEELTGPARSLTEELRTLKDAAGLSLSELATRTHYSRASWERWLNGKRVITEQALNALIGSVECDGPALRALWQQAVARPEDEARAEASVESPAEAAATAQTAETASTELVDPQAPAEQPESAVAVPAVAWWRRPVALLSCAAVLAVLLVLAGLKAIRHDAPEAPVADPVPPSAPVSASAGDSTDASPCRAVGCAHKNPQKTGCGKDARTLQTQVIGKVVIYLRYSQTCQAAWAAITEGEPKDYAIITDSTGDSETALIHYGYDNFSMMLNAADPSVGFQVCGFQPAGHDCTSTVANLASVVVSTPIPSGPLSPPPGAGASAAPTATPQPTASATGSVSPSPGAS
ncbi:helix-turn-helix domain-containing protein [Streptomyces kaniharaensis]|nr:XRE family transcriptional regulator [Streptomyces kaniharaensis]